MAMAWTGLLLLLCAWDLSHGEEAKDAHVTSISPLKGSLYGGALITIKGSGFAADQFSYGAGRGHKGNLVTLHSDKRNYICDIHKNGCTEKLITCYTRRMVAGSYRVHVKVDGKTVPDSNVCKGQKWNVNCKFQALSANTPTIARLTPASGPPGSEVETWGQIFSAFYGSNILSINSTNGITANVLRVYMGGQNCEMLDENGNINHLQLDGAEGESKMGTMRCKVESTYIGSMNMSYMIGGEYGRSQPIHDLLRVSAKNKIYMFQSYAEMASVSPTIGSTEGKTYLTISGNYLGDQTNYPLDVRIAGEACEVMEVSDEQIVCLTPAQPDAIPQHNAGQRGTTVEIWEGDGTIEALDTIATLTSASPGYAQFHVDEAFFKDKTDANVLGRIHGLFVPPAKGKYTFWLRGSAFAKLYVSDSADPGAKVETKTLSDISKNVWNDWDSPRSDPFHLDADKEYYFDVDFSGGPGAEIELAVWKYDTKFNADQSGWVRNEVQKFKTVSDVSTAIMTMNLTGFGPGGASAAVISEVQSVAISYANEDDTFQLIVDHAKTARLPVSVDGSTLQAALNKLLTIFPDNVTVSSESGGFEVKFNSNRGTRALMTVEIHSEGGTSINITRKVEGTRSYDEIVMDYNGFKAPAIPRSPTVEQVKQAAETMFSVRCPPEILCPTGKFYCNDFEDREPNLHVLEKGSRGGHEMPFSGTQSLKNPHQLFEHLPRSKDSESKAPNVIIVGSVKWLCFAYRGHFWEHVGVRYKVGRGEKIFFRKIFTQLKNDNHWHYKCVDLVEFKNTYHDDGDFIVILRLTVDRDYRYPMDAFVDSVYIGAAKPTEDPESIHERTIIPPVLARSVLVEKTPEDVFKIEVDPWACAVLDVIGVENDQNGDVEVTSVQVSSPPVGGSFDLKWKNHTVQIPADIAVQNLTSMLMALPGMGTVSTWRTGTCAGYEWRVEWLSMGGEQPLMEVSDSGDLTGPNAAVSSFQARAGGVFFHPIPGDLLTTYHNKPQVKLAVNGIPSRCLGDCSFDWDASQTPVVSSVTPLTGGAGTELTITGEGFDTTTPENNVVKIGGAICSVTSVTSATEFKCETGIGPFGAHPVWIVVTGKGAPTFSGGQPSYTYESSIDSINPTSGSIGGGTRITITGSGFVESASLKIGTNECADKNVTFSEIICSVPPGDGEGDLQVTVTFQDGTVRISPTDYSYLEASTVIIASVSPSVASAKGKEEVVLTGSGFGTTKPMVLVGSKPATVRAFSDTEITLELPPLPGGSHALKLSTQGKGYATMSDYTLPVIEVVFKVTGRSLEKCSVYGGCPVTITGEGFTEGVEVRFGKTSCDVTSVAATEISCFLQETTNTYHVFNNGSHPTFGEGYAWSETDLTVKVNDFVRWTWAAPVEGMVYRVQETLDVTSGYNGSGFSSSGNSTEMGSFLHQFTAAGLYHYWSGPVNPEGTIVMRGVVHVEEKESYSADLDVSVSGISANLVDPGSSSRKRRSVTTCGTAALDGCSSPEPSINNAFSIGFSKCLSPTVTSISPNSGTANTLITIKGHGFGTKADCLKVTVGGKPCLPTSQTPTEITCKVDPENVLEIGKDHAVIVRVEGLGYALLALDTKFKSFRLEPHVDSVSPNSGSLAGNTIVTVTGSGFVDNPVTSVTIDASPCVIEQVTYTEIRCRTTSRGGDVTATVQVVTGNQVVLEASCTGSCDFSYAAASTPEITQVSPLQAGADTAITISGSNFGSNPSATTVLVGDASCVVGGTSTESQIDCQLAYVAVGDNEVKVDVPELGKAQGSFIITGTAALDSVAPSRGSTAGGTVLTLDGNGFVEDDTAVTIGGRTCDIESVALNRVTCVTQATPAGDQDVSVVAQSVQFPTQTFTFSADVTPQVSAISPTTGSIGDTMTISGSGFSTVSGENTVTVGSAACSVTSQSADSLVCTLGAIEAGEYGVSVHVAGQGNAVSSLSFTYEMEVTGITPLQGSHGGGQLVTIAGLGLSDQASVAICEKPCDILSGSSTEIVCTTPESGVTGSTACRVVVTYGQTSVEVGYTYSDDSTASITKVTPRRGGTGGGTLITINGEKFGGDSTVTIAGTTCDIRTVDATEIICTTGPHRPSKIANVIVNNANGNALPVSAEFEYVDVWSSPFTWGGEAPPVHGEFVLVPTGQRLVLDVTTPVLKMLLIDGGEVWFDDNSDITLNAENILITGGGKLAVGTEEAPFQHEAIIQLHGQVRAPELPIYGAKAIAVRNGTLDLHGRRNANTWVLLAQTAEVGATSINVQVPVDWPAGSEILIATTGGHNSQKETELRTIASVSGDGLTLNFAEPLLYRHLGITETYGDADVSLDVRAEVGLLTRNVKVRGTSDPQWEELIEACEEGFDTGQFAEQTCYQGRFGEEMGNDQFGGHILFHAPVMDSQAAVGHLEYVEISYAGQAFRLGRYPVHFHLNGNMSKSYVRGCAIHHTFNRAINIHNSHGLMIENNVVYDVRGGAIFLEDGIETDNTLQYNLVVFVRSSSSLLNDDITPAGFWLTHPNNTVQHNHVAGGTHFGFWYRMHKHPDGPSFTTTICPRNAPLGIFFNNTVHSVGWYGLWIFETYHPMEGGTCDSKIPKPAVFKKLTTWNSFRGAEWVECGSVHFEDFVVANNFMAGLEHSFIVRGTPKYTEAGSLVKNAVVIGHLNVDVEDRPPCTKRGIVLPFDNGYLADGVKFINFDGEKNEGLTCGGIGTIKIICVCKTYCAGYKYLFQNIKWINSVHKSVFEWEHQAELEDGDGTLTGTVAGAKAVSTSGLLPPSCTHADEWSNNFRGSICPPGVDFVRMSFNKPDPPSLLFKNVNVTNEYGTVTLPYRLQSSTDGKGWLVMLTLGTTHTIFWENAEQINNFTFSGHVYGIEKDDWVIINHQLGQDAYDKIAILKDADKDKDFKSATPLSYPTNKNGQYYFDNRKKTLSYLIAHDTAHTIGLDGIITKDIAIQPSSTRCYYKDCKEPVDGDVTPPSKDRPADFIYSSDLTAWENGKARWAAPGVAGKGFPLENADVTIEKGTWMVVTSNNQFPRLNKLEVLGTLEFDYQLDSNKNVQNHTLQATYIIVRGRLLAGWPDNRYPGHLEIILHGNHATPHYPHQDGAPIGAKVIAVFGGLSFHGIDRDVYWTRLSQTARSGTQKITVEDAVDWQVGEEIVIGTTSYSPWQTETFKIMDVSPDKRTLTLNGSLEYSHVVQSETFPSISYSVGAEVGLLSRNIRIVGADYDGLFKESFGVRVIAGMQTDFDTLEAYRGYIRLENVEFFHSGQEGYDSVYDPRFSLAYKDTGEVTDVRPSFVRGCSFHNGFATAIGVFGTNGLVIEDNVIHHTVGSSILVKADRVSVLRNLIMLVVFSGVYQDRFEEGNFYWPAGIEAVEAVDASISGNVVAGSERAGFRLRGQPCIGATQSVATWTNNVGHGTLITLLMLPGDCVFASCTSYSGFYSWKAYLYGVYFQTKCSYELSNMRLLENTVGMLAIVVGPDSEKNEFAYNSVKLSDSLVVGLTDSFDCDKDNMDAADDAQSVQVASKAKSWFISDLKGKGGKTGRTGLSWPMFNRAANGAPAKPFALAKHQPALLGVFDVTGVTFAHFGSRCGETDRIFSINPSNKDVQHPIETSRIEKYDVADDALVYVPYPDPSNINGGECVDLPCDARRLSIVSDLDGSFLGRVGALTPDAEHEWEGDPRYGMGEYRIPKQMLVDLNNNRLTVQQVAPHIGIIRSEKCDLIDAMQAYVCLGYTYKLLLIESLDPDSTERRSGPLFILGEGFLLIINGPRDTGICHGYACNHRLSNFYPPLAIGKHYLIYYTSTPPQNVRLFLMNAKAFHTVRLAIYFGGLQRLDVYHNKIYIRPTNIIDVNGRPAYQQDSITNKAFYIPSLTSSLPTGSNYYDIDYKLIYILLRGPDPVTIHVKSVIILSLGTPSLTVAEFFGPKLVENLAAFLDVPVSKIRVVNAVNENSVTKRRKRATAITKATIEIGDGPSSTLDGSTGSGNDDLSYEDLTAASQKVKEGFQTGTLSNSLGITIDFFDVQDPPPPSDSANWGDFVKESDSGGEENQVPFQVPHQLVPVRVPTLATAGDGFLTQPKFQLVDKEGKAVTPATTINGAWKVSAKLEMKSGNSQAILVGQTVVFFIGSYAEFFNLGISHAGDNYQINFYVSNPATANFSYVLKDITVYSKTYGLKSNTSDVFRNSAFNLQVTLFDISKDKPAGESDFAVKSFQATLSLHPSVLAPGGLEGSLEAQFNPVTSAAIFRGLQLNATGRYALRVIVKSTPAGSYIRRNLILNVQDPSYKEPQIQMSRKIGMRFNEDFRTVQGEEAALETALYNELMKNSPNVLLENFTVTEGSIVVEFNVAGSEQDVAKSVDMMKDYVKSECSLTFNLAVLTCFQTISVDDEEQNFNTTEQVSNHEDSDLLLVAILVPILVVLLVVVIVLVVLVVKHKKKKAVGSSYSEKRGSMNESQKDFGLKYPAPISVADLNSPRNPTDGKPPASTLLPERPYSGKSQASSVPVRPGTADTVISKQGIVTNITPRARSVSQAGILPSIGK